MIYYLEQYDTRLSEEQHANDGENAEESEIQNILDKAASASEFKGFSVMLKPLADLSYIDILP